MDVFERLNQPAQGSKDSRKRVLEILKQKGSYHEQVKVVHVTGTSGKGSTSTMIAHGLTLAGHKTGLFTSPHLISINERIQINGIPIPMEEFEKTAQEILDEHPDLLHSEILFLTAMEYFRKNSVAYVVIEVFVGGRHDTTNVFSRPAATVLTSLGLDHKELLGNTLEEILREKLGICREEVPFFTPEATDLVAWETFVENIPLRIVKDKQDTNLIGEVQKVNAGTAHDVLAYLKIPEEIIKKALMSCSVPGRMQFLTPDIILDSAHNTLAMQKLSEFLRKTYPKKTFIYLLALSKGRNYEEYRNTLYNPEKIILTRPDMFKMLNPEDYARGDEIIIRDAEEGFRYAKSLLDGSNMLITCGSIFLIGEILKITMQERNL